MRVAVAALLIAASAGAAHAQTAPIRIGSSFSNSGTYAELGQTVHRGHQLCIKHANDKRAHSTETGSAR